MIIFCVYKVEPVPESPNTKRLSVESYKIGVWPEDVLHLMPYDDGKTWVRIRGESDRVVSGSIEEVAKRLSDARISFTRSC